MLPILELTAITKSIVAAGAIAWLHSTSREVSVAQPEFDCRGTPSGKYELTVAVGRLVRESKLARSKERVVLP
jgi:hypothetical protein